MNEWHAALSFLKKGYGVLDNEENMRERGKASKQRVKSGSQRKGKGEWGYKRVQSSPLSEYIGRAVKEGRQAAEHASFLQLQAGE